MLTFVVLFGVSPAAAQQSASASLLPPVEVDPPRKPTARKPTVAGGSHARSAAPSQAAAVPAALSPPGIVTPTAEAGTSITVVTEKDLAAQQARSLPDILSTIPGLTIVQAGGPGGQSTVSTRGTGPNHTKLVVDGIDLGNVTNSNGAPDIEHLLAADVQRIEVLRGPQSGFDGSDAIGGVIAITTRKGDGRPRATSSIETGAYQTFNQTAGLSGSEDRFNYAFNIAHLHAGNVPVTPWQLLPPGRKAIGNAYDNVTASTKLGVDINDAWTLNSVVRYTEASLLFTGDSGTPSFPNAAQSHHTDRQLATREEAVWSLLGGRLRNYFGVNYVNNWSYDLAADNPAATIATGERIKYDWRAVTELATRNHLVVGLEHQAERLKTTGLLAENGNKTGVVALETEFAERWFMVASLRDDLDDRFGSHGTYRIAPAVILPVTETRLKASYGSAFKVPTLSQLYQDFPAFNFFANPNLKPETSIGYDAGFEQPLFANRVRFGATYFHNNITNLISFNANATSYANVGFATTEGAESFVAADLTDRIKLSANYTFTRAVDAATGQQLLRQPKEKWSATALWTPLDALTLSATLLRIGSWLDVSRDGLTTGLTAPGYTLVNLRGDYALSDQVKLFGRIDNLFNRHYQNPTGFLAPGLGVFGGIRVATSGVQ
ncbi:TonB-dependent receptor domain-containing protein [Bradyrhizobium sp. SRS-191]|uniref:TonB-dependent receptor plug domain-containing protein n=1 Tax=Bradyrhizobium sp. SRS-191 TaxID=2962606 RepID=UPI00211E5435|nr:TonB-dependent receptor [Bradyrhizobium sp. SRS-191]